MHYKITFGLAEQLFPWKECLVIVHLYKSSKTLWPGTYHDLNSLFSLKNVRGSGHEASQHWS